MTLYRQMYLKSTEAKKIKSEVFKKIKQICLKDNIQINERTIIKICILLMDIIEKYKIKGINKKHIILNIVYCLIDQINISGVSGKEFKLQLKVFCEKVLEQMIDNIIELNKKGFKRNCKKCFFVC